jgi:branched-chain amino acid transport system substrate-binding protein
MAVSGLFGITSQALAQEVLRVGAPVPLTGALAPEGLKQKQGFDLWAEAANKAGGVKVGNQRMRVEIVYADYETKTPRAVQLIEKMIREDNVKFIFGPLGSGATKAASAVTERYKVPMIAPTAASEEVYDQGYKYLFGTLIPNQSLSEPLAQMVTDKLPDAKNAAILARNDLFPLAMGQAMDASLKKRGVKVNYFEKYAIGTMDHSSAITQMLRTNPDWILSTGYINDLILVRKQLQDQGAKVRVLTLVSAPAYKEYLDAVGPLAENVTSVTWWHPAAKYTGTDVFGSTENFVKQFNDKYKVDPDYNQASAAAAGAILQLAIEKAGKTDGTAVRDQLAAMNATTFFGKVGFGPSGQINSLEPVVFQIQGGKPVILSPASIKQGELRGTK